MAGDILIPVIIGGGPLAKPPPIKQRGLRTTAWNRNQPLRERRKRQPCRAGVGLARLLNVPDLERMTRLNL